MNWKKTLIRNLLLAVLWYGFGLFGYNAPLSTNTAPGGMSNITTRNPTSQ